MRIAVTYNGICDNIIEADSLETIVPMFPGADLIDANSVAIGIGWKWSNGVWAPLPPPPPSFVDLTRRQLLLALLSIGITEEMVDAQIDAIEDAGERAYSRIEWKAASSFRRHHALVDMMAPSFSLPVEQVDDLWRWAAGL